MDNPIPLKLARIEWKPNGRFRVSHYVDERCDRSLPRSGGACFALWHQMSDANREQWFLWHALMATCDGCQPGQVLDEINKVSELFDMCQRWAVRQSEVQEARRTRGMEAKDGATSSE